MLEGILEYILINYFGNYIDGIDRERIKLGVHDGNLLIQNVSLKNSLLEGIELPITLMFSHIGSLKISISWSQINQRPMQIHIKNLFLIFHPKKQHQWDFSYLHDVSGKLKLLSQLAKRLLQSRTQLINELSMEGNSKQSQRKQSFFSRLASKILDNIQLKVENIHFRFENPERVVLQSYSFGFTLECLDMLTMSQNWKEAQFFDRTLKENQRKPINKEIKIQNFCIYWVSHEQNLIIQQQGNAKPDSTAATDQMEALIRQISIVQKETSSPQLGSVNSASSGLNAGNNGSTSLIAHINFKVRLTINLDTLNQALPQQQIEIIYQTVDIHIRNNQLQDMMQLMTFISSYRSALKKEKDRYKLKMNRFQQKHSNNGRVAQSNQSNNLQANYSLIVGVGDSPFKGQNKGQKDSNIQMQKSQKYYLLWHFAVNSQRLNVRKKIFSKVFLQQISTQKEPKKLLQEQKNEYQRFFRIVLYTDIEELMRWGREEYILELKEAQNRDKHTSKSILSHIFSFWQDGWKIFIDEYQVTNVQEKQLINLADQIPEADLQQNQQKQQQNLTHEQQQQYIPQRLQLEMNNIRIKLSKSMQANMEEGISLECAKLVATLNKRTKNFELDLTAQKFHIIHYEKKGQTLNEIPLLQQVADARWQQPQQQQKLIYQQQQFQHQRLSAKPLLDVHMEQNPLSKPGIQLSLCLKLEQILIFYFPAIFERIMAYFSVKTYDQELVDYAYQKLQVLSHNSKQSLEEFLTNMQKNDIKITIQSPLIVIPFYKVINSECWVFRLGDWHFDSGQGTDNQIQGDLATTRNSQSSISKYEQFESDIESVQISYFSSIRSLEMFLSNVCNEITIIQQQINFCKQKCKHMLVGNSLQNTGGDNDDQLINLAPQDKQDLVEKFSIKLKLHTLKEYFSNEIELPRTNFSVKIDKICIRCNQDTLEKLLKSKDSFQLDLDNNVIVKEDLQIRKQYILDNSIKIGYLEKRSATFKVWSPVYAVFSGRYIYFYEHPTNLQYSYYIDLNGAQIEDTSKQIGRQHSFRLLLDNNQREVHFSCEAAASHREWLDVIHDKLNELQLLETQNFNDQNNNQQIKYKKNQNLLQQYFLMLGQLQIERLAICVLFQDKDKKKTTIIKNNVPTLDDDSQYKSSFKAELVLNQIFIEYKDLVQGQNLSASVASFWLLDQFESYPTELLQYIAVSQHLFDAQKNKNNLNNSEECKNNTIFNDQVLRQPELQQPNNQEILDHSTNVQKRKFIKLVLDVNNKLQSNAKTSFLGLHVQLGSILLNWKSLSLKQFQTLFKNLQAIVQQSNNSKPIRLSQHQNQAIHSSGNQQSTLITQHPYPPTQLLQKFQINNLNEQQKAYGAYLDYDDIEYYNNKNNSKRKQLEINSLHKVNFIRDNHQSQHAKSSNNYGNDQYKNNQLIQKSNQYKIDNDENPLIMSIDCTLEQISIILINTFSTERSSKGWAALSKITVFQISFHLDIKLLEQLYAGNINDIHVIDQTNYPDTTYTYLDFLRNEEQGYFIFRQDPNYKAVEAKEPHNFSNRQNTIYSPQNAEAGQKNSIKLENPFQSLMIFKYKKLDKQYCLKNNVKIKSLINVELFNPVLAYMQQPILRLVDFMLNQILPIVSADEDDEAVQQETNPQNQKIAFINRINSILFTSITFQMHGAIIVVKPVPQYNEWIEIHVDQIEGRSVQIKNFTRVNDQFKENYNSFIWEEEINITLARTFITYSTRSSQKPISNMFTCQIKINRMLLRDLFTVVKQYFQQEESFDYTIQIECIMKEQVSFQVLRSQYLALMRLIFNNILYDDCCDIFFIYRYEETSKLDSTPINLYMNFSHQLQLLFLETYGEYAQFLETLEMPAYQFVLQPASLSYARLLSKQKEITLYSQCLQAYAFTYQVRSDTMKSSSLQANKQGFIGDMSSSVISYDDIMNIIPDSPHASMSIENILVFNEERGDCSPSKIITEGIDFNKKASSNEKTVNNKQQKQKKDNSTSIKMECIIKNTGEKDIEIFLDSAKIMFNFRIIFEIMNFTYLDDTVQIVSPKCTFYKFIFVLSLFQIKLEFYTPALMVITLKLQDDTIICLQGPHSESILVIKGLAQISFQKNHSQIKHQELHEEEDNDDEQVSQENSQINEEEQPEIFPLLVERFQMGTSSQLKINATNLELFSCETSQLYALDTTTLSSTLVKKHSLLSPTNLYFTIDSFSCLCSKYHKKYYSEMKLHLDNTSLKLTLKDLVHLTKTVVLQTNEMWSAREFSKQLNLDNQQPKAQLQQQTQFQMSLKEYYLMQFKMKSFAINQIQINIVEDSNSFVPIFLLSLSLDPPYSIDYNKVELDFPKIGGGGGLVSGIQSQTKKEKQSQNGHFTLEILYFNAFVMRMEPIIEKTAILFNLVRGECNPQFNLALELSSTVQEDDNYSNVYEKALGKSGNQQPANFFRKREGGGGRHSAREPINLNSQCKQQQNKRKQLLINLSDQMVSIFYKSLRTLQQELQNFEKSQIGHQQNTQSPSAFSNFHTQQQILHEKLQDLSLQHQISVPSDQVILFYIKNFSGYNLIVKESRDNWLKKGTSTPKSINLSLNAQQNQRLINIKNMEEQQYQLDASTAAIKGERIDLLQLQQQQNLNIIFEQSTKVNIYFKDLMNSSYLIENIKVSKPFSEKRSWKPQISAVERPDQKKQNQIKKGYFICSVSIQDSKKYLTIYSPYFLQNTTNLEIKLLISGTTLILKPQQQIPLPLDYIDKNLQIAINLSDQNQQNEMTSEAIGIQTILGKTNGTLEIKVNSFYLQVYTQKDIKISNLTYINFSAKLVIYNCLPVKLFVKMLYDDKRNIRSERQKISQFKKTDDKEEIDCPFFLENQEIYHEVFADLRCILKVKVRIYGCMYTEEEVNLLDGTKQEVSKDIITQELQQNLMFPQLQSIHRTFGAVQMQKTTEIVLKDAQGDYSFSEQRVQSQKSIYMSREVMESGTVRVTFFAQSCIINMTPYDLVFYTTEEGPNQSEPIFGQLRKKKLQEEDGRRRIAGQILAMQELNAAVDGKVLILNQEARLCAALSSSPDEVSNDTAVSGVGQTNLELKVSNKEALPQAYSSNISIALYELGINVTTVLSAKHLQQYTKVIEVKPKYIVVNQTNFSLQIAQEPTQDDFVFNLFKRNDRTPIFWPDCCKEKTICIRICLFPVQIHQWQGSSDSALNSPESMQLIRLQSSARSQKSNSASANMQFSEWSGDIFINAPGTYCFFIKSMNILNTLRLQKRTSILYGKQIMDEQQQKEILQQTSQDKIFFKMTIIDKDASYFITIQSGAEADYIGYQLINNCASFDISCFQNVKGDSRLTTVDEEEMFQLQKGKQIPFAWAHPNHLPDLQIVIQSSGQASQMQEGKASSSEKLNRKQGMAELTLTRTTSKKKHFTIQQAHLQSQQQSQLLQLPSSSIQQQQQLQSTRYLNQSTINLNQINEKINIDIYGDKSVFVVLEPIYKGATKFLIFSELHPQAILNSSGNSLAGVGLASQAINNNNTTEKSGQMQGQQSFVQKMFTLYLQEVGISLIMHSKGKNLELSCITMQKLEAYYTITEQYKTFEARIKYLQIDNDTSPNPIFPVFLTPSKNEDISKNENKNMFEIFFQMKVSDQSILNIRHIQLNLQPISIKTDEKYIEFLTKTWHHIQKATKKSEETEKLADLSQIKIRNLFFMDWGVKELLLQRKHNICMEWYYCEIPVTQSYSVLRIQTLVLPPLHINLLITNTKHAFAMAQDNSQQHQQQQQQQQPLNSHLNALNLGTRIIKIDEIPIKLNGAVLREIYDYQQGILYQILEQYKKSILQILFKILGSMEYIGNPAQLFSKISSGVIDLIEKPLEGILRGKPLDVGKGIAEGVSSLLKNTVSGTFYSINKITSSISSGVSLFSFDNQYMEERNKFLQTKPKHLFEGLQLAASTIQRGIEEGVTGVFMQPYKGGVEAGVIGFIKGTALGLSGLVIKPVSGVLDAASKTAEGISNTCTYFDDKPRDTWMRAPRLFYDQAQYFREQSRFDQEIYHFLYQQDDGQYAQSTLIEYYLLLENQMEFYLILTTQAIFYVYRSPSKLKFMISSEQCKAAKQKTEDNRHVQIEFILSDSQSEKINGINLLKRDISIIRKLNTFEQSD